MTAKSLPILLTILICDGTTASAREIENISDQDDHNKGFINYLQINWLQNLAA